jgi:hypothetical protein
MHPIQRREDNIIANLIGVPGKKCLAASLTALLHGLSFFLNTLVDENGNQLASG